MTIDQKMDMAPHLLQSSETFSEKFFPKPFIRYFKTKIKFHFLIPLVGFGIESCH